MVVSPDFCVDTSCTPLQSVESLKSLETNPLWLFLLSIPMVELLIELDDDMVYI
jgi:hypothetical protein